MLSIVSNRIFERENTKMTDKTLVNTTSPVKTVVLSDNSWLISQSKISTVRLICLISLSGCLNQFRNWSWSTQKSFRLQTVAQVFLLTLFPRVCNILVATDQYCTEARSLPISEKHKLTFTMNRIETAKICSPYNFCFTHLIFRGVPKCSSVSGCSGLPVVLAHAGFYRAFYHRVHIPYFLNSVSSFYLALSLSSNKPQVLGV